MTKPVKYTCFISLFEGVLKYNSFVFSLFDYNWLGERTKQAISNILLFQGSETHIFVCERGSDRILGCISTKSSIVTTDCWF